MGYYKFYIQKETTGAEVYELGEKFGFYETSCNFYGGGAVKDVPSRNWYDEDGDDEYVPTAQKFKAYEMEVSFGYKGSQFTANTALQSLKSYLSGGTMKVYDTYNRIGRQNVRFMEISDDATLVRNSDDGDILIVKIKFKVNDPVTDVVLTK